MQDRIPVNPGRVLISPENGAPYYATMTRADNATQEGTPLNKNSLLKDSTAALFGLGVDAVPDDAFALLSRFQNGLGNEYVWAKVKNNWEIPVGNAYSLSLYNASYASYNTVYYSDKYSYDENTKTVTLVDYKTITVDYSKTDLTYLQALRGQYVIGNPAAAQNFAISSLNGTPMMYRIDDDATFTRGSVDIKCNAKIMTVANIQPNPTVFGYVNSPDPNAYPVNDGYTYTALGQLGAKVQIATGSYTGTGTYGASNPNSLTFGFAPKIVFISAYYSDRQHFFIAVNENSSAQYIESYKSGSVDGGISAITSFTKVLSWYSEQHAMGQMNASGATYNYIAIG